MQICEPSKQKPVQSSDRPEVWSKGTSYLCLLKTDTQLHLKASTSHVNLLCPHGTTTD
jgi:hypothetical protein